MWQGITAAILVAAAAAWLAVRYTRSFKGKASPGCGCGSPEAADCRHGDCSQGACPLMPPSPRQGPDKGSDRPESA